jgi:proteasome lid subunit RPN8/RPN11
VIDHVSPRAPHDASRSKEDLAGDRGAPSGGETWEMEASREATRVRIGPADEVAPGGGRIPLAHALRWWSPYEGPGREPYLAVFMTARAYVRCCAHAGSDLEREVGGALVGVWRRDRATGRPFIVVEAALPARHTRQGRSYVTFTHDSLVDLHEELEARYPLKKLVGWYHTHPGMDIFLSGYDLWLHEHFFPFAWQVALVIEPRARHGGFFVRGPDGQPHPRHYTGFGELIRRRGSDGVALAGETLGSVVGWENLRLDGTAALTEG